MSPMQNWQRRLSCLSQAPANATVSCVEKCLAVVLCWNIARLAKYIFICDRTVKMDESAPGLWSSSWSYWQCSLMFTVNAHVRASAINNMPLTASLFHIQIACYSNVGHNTFTNSIEKWRRSRVKRRVEMCGLLPWMPWLSVLVLQVEQISQLATFADNLLDYHKQCCEILDVLVTTLNEKWVPHFALYNLPHYATLFHILPNTFLHPAIHTLSRSATYTLLYSVVFNYTFTHQVYCHCV